MAGVEVSSTPAFTRLPVEILEQILEYNLPDKSQYSYWRDMFVSPSHNSLHMFTDVDTVSMWATSNLYV